MSTSNTPLSSDERCICGHERSLHHPEPGGLCIRDEWCHCPGYWAPPPDDDAYDYRRDPCNRPENIR